MTHIDNLLTIAEVARRREVDEATVRYWIAEGLLPVVRSRRPALIDPAILRRFRRPVRGRPVKNPGSASK